MKRSVSKKKREAIRGTARALLSLSPSVPINAKMNLNRAKRERDREKIKHVIVRII